MGDEGNGAIVVFGAALVGFGLEGLGEVGEGGDGFGGRGVGGGEDVGTIDEESGEGCVESAFGGACHGVTADEVMPEGSDGLDDGGFDGAYVGEDCGGGEVGDEGLDSGEDGAEGGAEEDDFGGGEDL